MMTAATATATATFASLSVGDTFTFAVAPYTAPLTKISPFAFAAGKEKFELDKVKTTKVLVLAN
jgi:hypothetical protein